MSNISKIKLTNGEYDVKDASAVSNVTRNGDTITVTKRSGTSSTYSAKSILPSAVNIDGISFTGGAGIHHYGTCPTGGSTANKVVTLTGTFTLNTGAKIFVNFANANTASSPTLNVNSTGAKNIYYKGVKITTNFNKTLLEGVCEFVYDGTQWHLIGDSPSFVGKPDTFSTTKSYSLGDYCIYDDTIYCCISAVTSGSAFNVNQWKAITLWSLVNDIEVDMGTISSLPVTKSVSDILPNYKVKEFILGEPSAQVGDWAVNTAWNNSSSTGTITVSGTISGSTTLKVLVGPCKTVTAS